MASILIVDDDDLMVSSLALMVRRLGHSAASAASLAEGLEMAGAQEFDVVFLDVRMPDGNGLEILPRLAGTAAEPEVIIITGFGEPDGAELAIKSGAWDYIEKGASVKEMTLSLERALQYRAERRAGNRKQNIVALKREDILGNSPKLRACLNQLAQAAGGDASILITGETGTGKELFARAIHQNSPRAAGNFVTVDCASLPETLAESLLFGHEKGAFTGADKTAIGKFELADHGTILLDEIGDMPLDLQVKLLRVLQEREVALELLLGSALRRRADDDPALGQVELLRDLLQPLTLGVLEPAGDADPLAERRVDEEAAGQRDLRREPRALRAHGVLDRLDEKGQAEIGHPDVARLGSSSELGEGIERFAERRGIARPMDQHEIDVVGPEV